MNVEQHQKSNRLPQKHGTREPTHQRNQRLQRSKVLNTQLKNRPKKTESVPRRLAHAERLACSTRQTKIAWPRRAQLHVTKCITYPAHDKSPSTYIALPHLKHGTIATAGTRIIWNLRASLTTVIRNSLREHSPDVGCEILERVVWSNRVAGPRRRSPEKKPVCVRRGSQNGIRDGTLSW